MPNRIDGGRVLAGAGGMLLIASLFFDWFGSDRSGWAAFELADLVLAGLAALAILAATPWGPAFARPERGLLWMGLAALAIVAEAIIDHPPGTAGRSLEGGAWLALAAALLITAGGLLRAARISIVVTLRTAETAQPEGSVGEPAQPAAAAGAEEVETPEDDIFPEEDLEEEVAEEDTQTLPVSRRGRS